MKITHLTRIPAIFLPTLCVGVFLLCLFSVFPTSSVSAQTALTPEQKARLERELAQVEAEQKAAEKELANAQAQSSSITRDISVLTAKIKVAQLNIKAKNLAIENLGKDIKGKQTHIDNLEDRIDRGKDSLAVIMRKTNEVASYTLPEILLSQSSLTGVLRDIDSFASVQNGLKETFEQVRSDKTETESEKNALEKRRNAETDARYSIQQEEKSIKNDEAEKRRLLSISKGNEAAYQADLAKKRQRAAEIRAALFPLRGSDPIPFSLALQYANTAAAKTGIRPAFLLAVIQQESNLGANVGTCNRIGDGPEKHWSKIMPGPADKAAGLSRRDDQTIFKRIVAALGISTEGLPLSCPWGAGWGGAMGPAQFIPSTWVLFESRISAAIGGAHPDPWNPSHAFMASAIYLSDLGANGKTYTAERNAACRYYSGRVCDARAPANAFYGNEVTNRADVIQRTMIDPLQGL
ncbi:MAG: lytic murein transglycosylase [Patescibacteria group bacterium]